MQRNLDLVRDILLFVESNSATVDYFSVQIDGYGEREINYHVYLLMQQEFITGTEPPLKHARVVVTGLTWTGHEYLDTVRSENVWNKTKELVKPVGSVSLDAILKIATEVAVKSVMGV